MAWKWETTFWPFEFREKFQIFQTSSSNFKNASTGESFVPQLRIHRSRGAREASFVPLFDSRVWINEKNEEKNSRDVDHPLETFPPSHVMCVISLAFFLFLCVENTSEYSFFTIYIVYRRPCLQGCHGFLLSIVCSFWSFRLRFFKKVFHAVSRVFLFNGKNPLFTYTIH